MSEQNYPSYLIHYGIQGQHWNERRYQNEDGTYTEEGLRRRRAIETAEGDHAKGRSLVKSGVKSTASGVGDAFRAGNRTIRGVAKTATRGNVVFAKNALSGIGSGIKSVMNGGDAKEGLNIAKKGISTGASQAAEMKKQVAKESAESVASAAKSSAEKVSVGAIETAAGTAKMAKAQSTIKREKNIKVSSIVMHDSIITPRKVKKITNA